MTIHIDTLRNSRCYSTRCIKKEFRPLGSSEIIFRSLSKMNHEDGTHLRPLKQKEIGMS
jgi:hypothetical protein